MFGLKHLHSVDSKFRVKRRNKFCARFELVVFSLFYSRKYFYFIGIPHSKMIALSSIIFLMICILSITKHSIARIVHTQANEIAPSNKFLFAASISSASHHSGVILNRRWIISSALCISQNTVSTLQIRYGSHNSAYIGIVNDDIEKIIVHPNFEQRILQNNFALIKVKIRFIPTVV